jgi:hypothetical protein
LFTGAFLSQPFFRQQKRASAPARPPKTPHPRSQGPESVEDTFCLTMSLEMDYFGDLRTVPLRPGGEDIAVTEENRHEYVELMTDYLLNK